MHGKLLFGKIVAMPDSRWKLVSIRTLREEGDLQAAPATAWRATGSFPADMSLTVISIHALREEGDRWAVIEMVASYDFYPRPPRGGRQSRPVRP